MTGFTARTSTAAVGCQHDAGLGWGSLEIRNQLRIASRPPRASPAQPAAPACVSGNIIWAVPLGLRSGWWATLARALTTHMQAVAQHMSPIMAALRGIPKAYLQLGRLLAVTGGSGAVGSNSKRASAGHHARRPRTLSLPAPSVRAAKSAGSGLPAQGRCRCRPDVTGRSAADQGRASGFQLAEGQRRISAGHAARQPALRRPSAKPSASATLERA